MSKIPNAAPFGPKSREAIRAHGFLTVYEGAVRSAKTVTSLVQWYKYVVHSKETTFLMSGHTLGSISRNCIQGDYGFLSLTGWMAQQKSDVDGSKYILLGDKKIYYCGADNAASYKKIQGMSLGGWYADEVGNHDRAFLEMALTRTIASSDRQHIWTLNPEAPSHWIYSDYIDHYKASKMPGYNYFHFTLDDNPALSEDRKAEIRNQFKGVFYRRYVLGQRVRAEGAIYGSFVHNRVGEVGSVLDVVPDNILKITVGVDFGGNGSATVFSATGWYMRDRAVHIVTLEEVFDDSHVGGSAGVNSRWVTFIRMLQAKYTAPIESAWADSAEQLMRKSMNNQGLPVHAGNSMKRPIIDRIRVAEVLYAAGRKHIMRHCVHLIEAVESAAWDPKAASASRLDNGTVNVDSLDADEYSWEREASILVEWIK